MTIFRYLLTLITFFAASFFRRFLEGKNLLFFTFFLVGWILFFRFLCSRRVNRFFLILMYVAILLAISVFLYCLRSLLLFYFNLSLSGIILLYMLGGEGTAPGNFETSPPAMSQQGGIPGENEPGGESLLKNLEQPRGEPAQQRPAEPTLKPSNQEPPILHP